MSEQGTTDSQQTLDDQERERRERFLRFAGVLLVIVVLWYVFGVAHWV